MSDDRPRCPCDFCDLVNKCDGNCEYLQLKEPMNFLEQTQHLTTLNREGE